MRKVGKWLASIGRQIARAFGLGPEMPSLNWGTTVFPVTDRATLDALWWTQHAIVTGRGTAAKYASPEGLRYGVYQGERFPDGSSHWGKYWAHSRVIVVLHRHEQNMALWSHECRHDVLGTEDHPPAFFRGSSLDLP
jgi:hypothetical protein